MLSTGEYAKLFRLPVLLNREASFKRGCALLLGGFDGLHVGHATLIDAAKSTGLPVAAMTICEGKGTPLFTKEERMEIFRECGVSIAYPLDFSHIKDVSARDFSCGIVSASHAVHAFCGEDFRFGAGGGASGGDFERFTGVPVTVCPLKTDADGEKIGSERIKELLSLGDAATVSKLLVGGFFLRGEVVKDRGVGRTIGFPTANIRYPEGKHLLKHGVYETRAVIDGKEYRGVTNFGARPTFGVFAVTTETHFIGYTGDLYGKTLTLRFIRFLRDVCEFSDADALKKQLQSDVRRVKESD